jgi:predicted AAA+ superfamily ATPase
VRDSVKWDHDSSVENGETKEKLVIKKMALSDKQKLTLRPHQLKQKMALISRYPMNAVCNWIEANEQEALEWDYDEQNSRICLDYPIKNAM